MPKLGQLKGTPARRAAFIEEIRLLGEGPECVYWPWSDRRDTYASVHVDGVKMRASRWVYEQFSGPLPERHGRGARGVLVLHKCDNPPCVRPSHLFSGTQDDNMKDASAKGRKIGGRGNHHFRLASADVEAIKADLSAGGVTQHAIARKFGVSDTTISMIANGRRKGSRTIKPITSDRVRIAVALRREGVSMVTIAAAYGVSVGVLSGAVGRLVNEVD